MTPEDELEMLWVESLVTLLGDVDAFVNDTASECLSARLNNIVRIVEETSATSPSNLSSLRNVLSNLFAMEQQDFTDDVVAANAIICPVRLTPGNSYFKGQVMSGETAVAVATVVVTAATSVVKFAENERQEEQLRFHVLDDLNFPKTRHAGSRGVLLELELYVNEVASNLFAMEQQDFTDGVVAAATQ